jgi:hypothetical protein
MPRGQNIWAAVTLRTEDRCAGIQAFALSGRAQPLGLDAFLAFLHIYHLVISRYLLRGMSDE